MKAPIGRTASVSRIATVTLETSVRNSWAISFSTNTRMKKSKASSVHPRKLAATTCFCSLDQPERAAIAMVFSPVSDCTGFAAKLHGFTAQAANGSNAWIAYLSVSVSRNRSVSVAVDGENHELGDLHMGRLIKGEQDAGGDVGRLQRHLELIEIGLFLGRIAAIAGDD